MEELRKDHIAFIEREYPEAYRETLVVLDGTTGQNALAQAKQFTEVADMYRYYPYKAGRNSQRRYCSCNPVRAWYSGQIYRSW